jgi:S1-C subfamily serine protease
MSKLDAQPERLSNWGAVTGTTVVGDEREAQSRNDEAPDRGDDEEHFSVVAAGEDGGGPWSRDPWAGANWAPPPSRRRRFGWLARFAAAGAALMIIGTGVGFAVLGRNTTSTATAATSAVVGSAATSVDQGVVDVNTTLGYQGGSAAGTGLVLSSSGEVLTNNHVVAGATGISVTDVGDGHTYTATVVGTDLTDDIAVLQLNGASGLKTIAVGNSAKVAVGDAVTAVGNAGGAGGTPSVATGTVSALGQSITASDEGNGSSEKLTGLIETNAAIQAGDSGGPLVNSSGQVIAIDTAASSGFRFQSGDNQGFAIPINEATTIARQIEAGQSSATVHIGPYGFLGVQVQASSASSLGSSSSGALVAGAESGSPAERAGLTAGDEIVSLGGQPVESASTLTNLMQRYHPGDEVQLGWVDGSGQQHTATMTLATGPVG